jgi:ABC-type molybdate transport system substrate-binding protein
MGPIPGEEYPPIQQAAVILKASQHKAVANQFMAFLKKPEIVALLEKYGFAVPKNQLRRRRREVRKDRTANPCS